MTSRMNVTAKSRKKKEQDETALYQLVVVGSSAGGIEALSTLVASLPTTFPAPIVLAQHLDPTHPSHLGEILARRSTLPVHTVTNQEPLLPGVVYVVPADRHVEITDHVVRLRTDSESKRRSPKPSVDRLLTTAARVYGEQLIAVILTGTGSDGTAGARAVKAAGGLVLIENPATAAYPGMPESLAPSTVDMVADLARMGPLLSELLTATYSLAPSAQSAQTTAAQEEEQFFQAILIQVRERRGLDFSRYKRPTIVRRLQRRLVAIGLHQLSDYLRYLARHPEEYDRLIASFLINVTEFFRDPALFAVLRDQVLPELVVHSRAQGNELRFWSAGCATGEEAYSLAILVAEALGEELDQFTVQIFATDLNEEAVAIARRALYPAASLAYMPQDLRSRYFVLLDKEPQSTSAGHLARSQNDEYTATYEVTPCIRRLVTFGQHDLGQRAPFPRIDLVLCRNVLMYFTPELQKRTLQLFAFALRDGGYLALGKAESAKPLEANFASAHLPPHQQVKLYRRNGERVLAPIARMRVSAASLPSSLPDTLLPNRHRQPSLPAPQRVIVSPTLIPHKTPGTVSGTQNKHTGVAHIYSISESLGNLLLDAEVGIIVVDQNYDIQTLNSAARHLLGIYREAVGKDLVHLVQNVPATALRSAIDAALHLPERGSALGPIAPPQLEPKTAAELEQAGSDTIVTVETIQGEPRDLQIICYPQRPRQQGVDDLAAAGTPQVVPTREERVLVLVSDVTQLVHKQRASSMATARDEIERERVRAGASGDFQQAYLAKIADVERLRAQMEAALLNNRTLAQANQELADANLVLRSATDELFVGREEAEASAEEIKTLNEELQATNEELVTVNEELEATVEELHIANEDLDGRSSELQRLATAREVHLEHWSAEEPV